MKNDLFNNGYIKKAMLANLSVQLRRKIFIKNLIKSRMNLKVLIAVILLTFVEARPRRSRKFSRQSKQIDTFKKSVCNFKFCNKCGIEIFQTRGTSRFSKICLSVKEQIPSCCPSSGKMLKFDF